MTKKDSFDEEVKKILGMIKPVQVGEYTVMDYSEMLQYAKSQGLRMDEIIDDEGERAIRVKIKRDKDN